MHLFLLPFGRRLHLLGGTLFQILIPLLLAGYFLVGRRIAAYFGSLNCSSNRPNHLFVIVGPDTFSAAMANAAHFRERTAAILVGEAIGERPNSNQEPREFRLRNSQLMVRYSTRRYEFDKQNRENVIRPDHEIRPTWEMYKAGRDPVLEWIEAVRVQ